MVVGFKDCVKKAGALVTRISKHPQKERSRKGAKTTRKGKLKHAPPGGGLQQRGENRGTEEAGEGLRPIMLEYLQEISVRCIALKLPDELLDEIGRAAWSGR